MRECLPPTTAIEWTNGTVVNMFLAPRLYNETDDSIIHNEEPRSWAIRSSRLPGNQRRVQICPDGRGASGKGQPGLSQEEKHAGLWTSAFLDKHGFWRPLATPANFALTRRR